VLQPKVEPGRHRYVFFLTDGFVGGEQEIVDEANRLVSVMEKKDQHARVFGVGIGSSPNRHLIEELSNAGKGLATYAGNREDPARAINKIYHYIDRAVLTEVKPDLAAIGAEDVVPFETPDLFASHPVVLHGHYKNAPTGPVVIRAKVGTESVEIPVDVRRAVGETMGTLGRLWARAKITSLEQRVGGEDMVAANKEITNLGLMFHLVTRNTSLIAIDSSQTVSDGNPEKIVQPVDGPEDVDLERAAEELEESQTRMDCPADFAACGAENLDMEVAHGARGCHCRMGAGTSPSGGMAAGVVFVLVYLGRRRAKKRTPKSHS